MNSVGIEGGRLRRQVAVAAAAACLLATVACIARPDALLGAPQRAEELLGGGRSSAQLKRLSGLIGEVSAVKHALLAIANREAAMQTQQLAAARVLPGNLPLPRHTDSFDYDASVGHQGAAFPLLIVTARENGAILFTDAVREWFYSLY